jgi:acyl-coenzyme A thioesterase PaaI-like protein
METEGLDGPVPIPDVGCFGCSPTNRDGLGLRFERLGDAVYSACRIPERLHGAPAIAHGGIVATILDEVSCVAALALEGSWVVTGELSVRFSRPCPVETDLEASARITGSHPRYLVVEAEIRLNSVVLARSSGKFFPQQRAENAP